ncbi:MAG: glycine cleavage system protein GcvH [Deltaproteobacteria bacterium]|nr:MAG: glycine cleavage system protein GcvH [Deltaproteobacteria bacterium]
MEFPSDLKYTKEHEWVRVEADDEAVIGITDFAQDQLGEIVFVELPEVNEEFSKEENIATVESVKAVSDVYAPVSGTVLEVNVDLPNVPGTINEDPYGDGWMVRIKMTDPTEVDSLMDADEYEEYVAESSEEDDDFDDDDE